MSNDSAQFKVLVTGAGVAGLEGVLALRDLAGEHVSIQLLAPESEFVYRPLRVREPFAHGAISAQQADPAAEAIAALAGVEIEPAAFEPPVYGMLLTGGAPKYMRARVSGGHGFSSEVSDQPLWSPPRKIVAKYLGPHLERLQSL